MFLTTRLQRLRRHQPQRLIAITLSLMAALTFSSNLFASESETTMPSSQQKTILGWVEYVELQPWNLQAKAKLDTGAKTSSIHATNIEWFEKDGDDWVRFQFANSTSAADSEADKPITIEAPVERKVRIKRHGSTHLRRAVVKLPFTLGGERYEAQFSLADRSKFLYPVLLGRRFLRDVALVDPDNTYLKTIKQ